MLLTDATLVLPDRLQRGWLRLLGGRIAELGEGAPPVAEPGEERLDLAGRLVTAGLIDLHVHGGGGFSYHDGDPQAVALGRAFHRSQGTTRSLASLVSAPVEELVVALSSLAELTESGLILGVHLEGPFLSPAYRGAHDLRYLLEPDRQVMARLLGAGRSSVRMVTVAPELPGAIELIRQIGDAGAIPAIGHSDAGYEVACAAIDAGARVATHLGNGMRPIHQREPGILAAALEHGGIACELVADGRHLHPAFVRLVAAVAGERMVLVTDAISAAGAPDGRYRVGPVPVSVEHGEAYVEGTRTIAGSTATLGGVVRHAVLEAGIPLVAAVRAASHVPALLLGIADEVGTLERGKWADLVVFDAELRVESVMVEGSWSTASPEERRG